MIDLPVSTVFGRRIPKTKFYENITVNAQLKRFFVEQISQIVWQNKIAPTTANIAAGEMVKEIEVFTVKLNRKSLDQKVLSQIDKAIPYHILFLLEHGGETQAWIGYKEEIQTKSGTFKLGAYYHTDWVKPENLTLNLNALNMDTLYESFIRQIAGGRLAPDNTPDEIGIKEAIRRDEKLQRLQREIDALTKKVQSEKQFNRQVALNAELKRLRAGLEGLQWITKRKCGESSLL
jgi:hypothetical protein